MRRVRETTAAPYGAAPRPTLFEVIIERTDGTHYARLLSESEGICSACIRVCGELATNEPGARVVAISEYPGWNHHDWTRDWRNVERPPVPPEVAALARIAGNTSQNG
jgi:hypothetical protein